MKVTLNWLKEFVPIHLSPKDLAHGLTMAGLEVESIMPVGDLSPLIVTAKIEKIEKHPHADRLTVCQVNTGSPSPEIHTIVCGAKNMKEGDVVPLAEPGAILPNGKKIERSKIREVESAGMLCSEEELGLASSASGLMILPSHTPLGKSVAEILNLSDVLFEINVTPNRSDCLSVMGIAREIAAITQEIFTPLLLKLPKKGFSLKGKLAIEAKEKKTCPRYTARMIRGVKILPSPFWVQYRLKNVGIRPINNVVDATNYVMMETGHPLHAFDHEFIAGGKIKVERALQKTSFKTLDENERILNPDDLLITDSEKPLALAGVMGGFHSAVSEKTQDLVLEAAVFDPVSIRKTSKRLGVMTESSYRFERGVDSQGVKTASDRLAQCILAWAGGEISHEFLDTHSRPFAPKKIDLRIPRIHKILGVSFSPKKVESILKSLQIKIRKKTKESWRCTVPSYRKDLEREIDLIEEIARVGGYSKIPETLPTGRAHLTHDFDQEPKERLLRNTLQARGFSEWIHYGFSSEKKIRRAGLDIQQSFLIANPLSEDFSRMRSSLVPSVLESLKYNLDRQNHPLKVYEFGNVYVKNTSGHFLESKRVCLAWMGKRYEKHWAYSREEVDYYDLKGEVEGIWKTLHLPSFSLVPSKKEYLHPGKSAEILLGEVSVGHYGLIHPQVALNFELEVPVVLGEIDFSTLLKLSTFIPHFEALPRYPSIERDLTLVVPEELKVQEVIDKISSLRINLIQEVKFFDIYRGAPIEEKKKALTYSICYQDKDRTLTDEEINQTHTNLVERLKTLLPIEWR